MPQPSATWNTKRVFITYRNLSTRLMEPGSWTADINGRITNTLSDGTRQVFKAGRFTSGPLNTLEGEPSLSVDLPIVDDPDNSPQGGQVTLTVLFSTGDREAFALSPLLSWSDAGTDLALILDPTLIPSAPPFAIVGVPGGVAELNEAGLVVNADGSLPASGGGTATTSASDLTTGTLAAARIAAGSLPQSKLQARGKRTISSNYTLVLGDATDYTLHSTASTPVTVTLPLDAAVAFPVETAIPWRQYGAGLVTFTDGTTTVATAGQNSTGWATKVAANTWLLSGDLAPIGA